MTQEYELLEDHFAMGLKAGQKVYSLKFHDYGLASDDTRISGVDHISVTLNSDGDYPSVTCPRHKLKIVNHHQPKGEHPMTTHDEMIEAATKRIRATLKEFELPERCAKFWGGMETEDVIVWEAELAAKAALSPILEQMRWRDISEAPRDGKSIYGENYITGQRGIVFLNSQREWELVDGLTNFPMGVGFYPTHWKPLPPSPTQKD